MGGGESATTKRCGVVEFTFFVLAVVTGTACSICSKTMMELHGIGIDGDTEMFTKPLFQTFGMFVGMLFGLVMHEVVLWFKIPFPGYKHEPASEGNATKNKPVEYGSIDENKGLLDNTVPDVEKKSIAGRTPMWLLLFLAIPSIFDLGATALCMMGLRYLDVSIYQLLRGSGIIFVALMKQHVRDGIPVLLVPSAHASIDSVFRHWLQHCSHLQSLVVHNRSSATNCTHFNG